MAIPVSLEDAKRQLRQGGETLDAERTAEINGFIADAAAWVERYTGHILVARDVTETFRVPARAISLLAWPIASTAVATITAPDQQPVAGVQFDSGSRPATVRPARGGCWPLSAVDESITVKVRAGYEPSDPVPGNMRRAMLILISAYDQDREGGEVFQAAEASARSLCRDFRLAKI